MAVSKPEISAPFITIRKPMKSANDPFQNLPNVSFGGRISPTAMKTMTLVAAVGIHWNWSVIALMARKTSPDENNPARGDLTPVEEFRAVRARDPETGMPPKTPFKRFAVPRKTSS